MVSFAGFALFTDYNYKFCKILENYARKNLQKMAFY